MPLAATEWTPVLVALAAGLPGIVASVLAFMNRRDLRTPSGDPIGHVVERTHDLSAVDVGATSAVLSHVTGDPDGARKTIADLTNGAQEKYGPKDGHG